MPDDDVCMWETVTGDTLPQYMNGSSNQLKYLRKLYDQFQRRAQIHQKSKIDELLEYVTYKQTDIHKSKKNLFR